MKHKWTVVIHIAGREMARSTPMDKSKVREWIETKKTFYRNLLDSKPWVIYMETASRMHKTEKAKQP
jgi:hypothetical protein